MSTVPLRNPRTVLTCPRCAGEAVLTAGGLKCTEGRPAPVEPLRPAGHGAGLDGPVCSQRAGRDQTPDGQRVRGCVRCGRITVRLDADGAAWCGGVLDGEDLGRLCLRCGTNLDPAHGAGGTHPECDPRPVRHLTLVGAA